MEDKMKKYVMAGIIGIITVIWGIQVVQVNIKYPKPVEKVYHQGEKVRSDHLDIVVKSSKFYHCDELLQEFPDVNPDQMKKNDTQYEILKVCFYNCGKTPVKPSSYEYYLSSTGWFNGLDMNLFYMINSELIKKDKKAGYIDPNASVDLLIPYCFHKKQFTTTEWRRISNKTFDYVVSLYPQKKVIRINTSK
jgi:hypothetical protein